MKLVTLVTLIATAASVHGETWRFTDINSHERESLCRGQINACQGICGGPGQTETVFCNSETLAWGCKCKSDSRTLYKWELPIPNRDCSGSRRACKINCEQMPDGEDRGLCFKNCALTHKCHTEDAPVSYTETKDVNETPKYVGPAVSYRGDKLGDLNDGNDHGDVGVKINDSDDKSSSTEKSDDRSDDKSNDSKSDDSKSDDSKSDDNSDDKRDNSADTDTATDTDTDSEDSTDDDSGASSISAKFLGASGIALALASLTF